MATPYHISVSARDTGLLAVEQNDAAAARVSELLQKDLESHHVFFNDQGFHNHISHQLLGLYGTGADPSDLQAAYDANASYQIKASEPSRGLAIVEELEANWPAHAPRYLGLGRHYADFLRYFQRQIERSTGGWEAVVKEHLLADGPAALDLRGRLFAGFLHPLIQLMYGIEWRQPAMVAEGLAQAAVHGSRDGEFLTKVDKAAAAAAAAPQQYRPLAETLENIRTEHPKLATSARWTDADRLHDGVMGRAEPEAVALLAGIRVRPEDLAERTAEMVHGAAYVAAAAAYNPPHVPKFDFFIIHHLTSIPFFLAINKLDWISPASKASLLEWKLRMDVLQYVARGCPPLRREALQPPPAGAAPEAPRLVPRFHGIVDDGHTIKVVRALLLAQRESRAWSGRPWIRIADDAAWDRVMHLLLSGVEGNPSQFWVRSAGFEEAWADIPKAAL